MRASGFVMVDEAGDALAVSVDGGCDLVKSHVKGYTNKKGTFVAEHDDKREKKAEDKAEPKDDKKPMDGEGEKEPDLPGAVGHAVKQLGGGSWTHEDGKSNHPVRFGGGNHLNTMDALGDNGWNMVHSSDDASVMTHPDGHTAVVDRQNGLTIYHGKQAKGGKDEKAGKE